MHCQKQIAPCKCNYTHLIVLDSKFAQLAIEFRSVAVACPREYAATRFAGSATVPIKLIPSR